TQNTPASVVANTFGISDASGEPFSRIAPAGPPNAPAVAWPGQKSPFASRSCVVAVVTGDSDTASRPWYCRSSGGHSIVVFVDPTPPLHASPARCPAVQTWLTHCGHGESGRLVR